MLSIAIGILESQGYLQRSEESNLHPLGGPDLCRGRLSADGLQFRHGLRLTLQTGQLSLKLEEPKLGSPWRSVLSRMTICGIVMNKRTLSTQ